MVCRSMDACQLKRSPKCFSNLQRLGLFQLLSSQQILDSVSFDQIQVFNQTMVSFVERRVYRRSSDVRENT